MTQQTANAEELMSKLRMKVSEIFEGEKFTAKEWKPFYRLDMLLHYFPDEQTKQVSRDETEAIRQLHEDHPTYSIED